MSKQQKITLNWKGNINETSKKNAQSLFDVFDQFIAENHKTQFSYDQKIRNEWEAFRKVIQADPADVQSHNKYVNMLKTNVNARDDGLARVTNRMNMRFQNIQPILMQINRAKLQEIARKTSRLILKNTKTTLKL